MNPQDPRPNDPSAEADADEQQALQALDELSEKTEEAEALRRDLDAARADAAAKQEQVLRLAADLQNVRRRFDEDRRRLGAEGKADAVRAFLGVLDDLARAVDAAKGAADPVAVNLRNGVEGVLRNAETVLSNLGVEPIEAVGAVFHEDAHEALLKQPTEGATPGTVVGELRRGYRMGDRVLRHSQVIVAA